MPLPVSTKLYNTFVKGLVTEANPLVFPEATAKTITNIDIARTGEVSRRLGMDIENGGARSSDTWTASSLKTAAVSTHEWPAVNGDGSLSFAVIQIGGVLYFHNAGADAISAEPIGKLDLTPLSIRTDFDEHAFDTSSGAGRFFVVGRYISPLYIEYDEDDNTFTGFKLSLKIRDVDGISEENDASPDITNNPVVSEDEQAVFQDTIDTINNNDYTIRFTAEDIGESGVAY